MTSFIRRLSSFGLAGALLAVTGFGQVPASSRDAFDLLRKGDVAAVKAMVERTPALVEARDDQGQTLLHYAAYGQDPSLVDFLIDKGAKVDLAGAQTKTPLHIAAIGDRREIVAALLKRGASLEIRDDYGRTALILCARERGQAATARVLLDAGADIDAIDKFGSSALELAAWRGKEELVDLLLDRGAKVPDRGEIWANMLKEAVSNGLARLFRRLAEGGQDLKALDPAGESLLQAAAAGGSAEIVGLLIERGFAPAKADRFGWTPLHYAARDGRTEAARILLERGAPLNARTVMGQTAYNVAAERKMGAVTALLAGKGADRSAARFPVLRGDYLGQKPPADKPELFAPGIISSIWGLHSTAVFSPDGAEVWWAPMMTFPGEVYSHGGLLMMKRVQDRWSPPEWAPFSGPDSDDDVPFFSADGKRLYFISSRPLPGETQGPGERIWFSDRTPGGWAAPRPLDPSVNAVDKHWQFSLDLGANLYFAGRPPDSRGASDIYRARFDRDRYEKPVNLGDPINTAGIDDTPFVAPDGSYLLFSRQFDLWASFLGPDGAWGTPVNLGPEVNSPSIELCPMVTADGKYLFFLSQRGGESHAYWVRADIIEKLREKTRVEQAIRAAIGWAKDKDFDLLYRTIADDRDFLEVHPDGAVVKGIDEFKKAEKTWRSPDFRAVRYEIRDLRIKLARSGDVAWFFGILDDINEWKGRPANWENTRWTGVLEKRDGRWVMVQQHFSSAAPEPLELAYLANMGVLVRAGGKKVLIDALFDKPNPDYRAPSPETLGRIMNGEAPFDNVDLVLVTHDHPDHFDASLAVRYLENRPDAVLMAPADAVEGMRQAAADWTRIGPRVAPVDLKIGEKETRGLKGVSVTACRTLHSGNRDAPMNLMYIIEFGGRRVWHEGDTNGQPEVFRAFGLDRTPLDLAIVHYWMPLDQNGSRFLQEELQASHIALAHLPVRLEGDAPVKIESVRQYYKDLILLLPGTPAKAFRD
ncbi:MAG TPA: ankyrin repeat domain-containing protein [Acidobacteriota bacterium]|nr:ankyrin repeat domain-containing protein [Acidobacteriota bacterium]